MRTCTSLYVGGLSCRLLKGGKARIIGEKAKIGGISVRCLPLKVPCKGGGVLQTAELDRI